MCADTIISVETRFTLVQFALIRNRFNINQNKPLLNQNRRVHATAYSGLTKRMQMCTWTVTECLVDNGRSRF